MCALYLADKSIAAIPPDASRSALAIPCPPREADRGMIKEEEPIRSPRAIRFNRVAPRLRLRLLPRIPGIVRGLRLHNTNVRTPHCIAIEYPRNMHRLY